MSKFDLRDISERLARSRDTEAVVHEFLGYLQAMRGDWRAALAFYEVSHDALISVYERHGGRLVRRNIKLPVSQLPARLVRKFFHPSAFFNQSDRSSVISQLLSGSPYHEPEPGEAAALRPITPLPNWQSCVCLPLADQEDVLALLVVASEKDGAFGSRTVADIMPIKSMAALAISQHLYRSSRGHKANGHAAAPQAAAADFQDRIHRLNSQTSELEEDNRAKAQRVEALTREIELLDQNSSEYKAELERVKETLQVLEQQSAQTAEQLTDAYSQLTVSEARAAELQRTIAFAKETLQALAHEHDPAALPASLVSWFGEQFNIDRCSLMQVDGSGEALVIAAARGIDPEMAKHIRVRIGQGVSGWVAHNRKPLHVRVKHEAGEAGRSGRDDYNSDSFISVPLIYNHRLWGVLNLSNKHAGEPFDDMDLDRAQLSASVLATVLGSRAMSRPTLPFAPAPTPRQAVTVRG
jgi:signal transduction protein with GAF and PtsI domain